MKKIWLLLILKITKEAQPRFKMEMDILIMLKTKPEINQIQCLKDHRLFKIIIVINQAGLMILTIKNQRKKKWWDS